MEEPYVFDLDDDLDDLDLDDSSETQAPAPVDKDDIRIPKARFDEETRKLREANAALQAQLDGAKASTPADPLVELNAKLDELEEAYEDAMIEGDKALSKQLRTQLRAVRGQVDTYHRNNTTHEAASMSREETTFQTVVAEIERNHPMFDSTSPRFDAEATQDVLAMMAGYTQNGMNRTDALKKAVSRLAPPSNQRGLRDASSRARNADAARRQPPSRPGIGNSPADDMDVDIMRLSPSDIAKMDSRKLSVLRGDYLE